MVHTCIVIGMFFVLLVLPCAVASGIDMDEEEAIANERELR